MTSVFPVVWQLLYCFVPTVNKVDLKFIWASKTCQHVHDSGIAPCIMPLHWLYFKCVVAFQESQTHLKHVLPCTGWKEGDGRDREPTWVALLRSYPESPTFMTRISSPFTQSLALCKRVSELVGNILVSAGRAVRMKGQEVVWRPVV